MKRCKSCREQFTPFNTLQKYCLNDECVKVFVAEVKEKDWKKRKAKAKAELTTVQDYLKIAQQVFNTFIRKRDQGKPCISCGKNLVGKFDASHYYNANNHWNVRFDEMNVHGACVECNQWKHGNLIEYGIRLEKLIGEDEFTILREKAYQLRKFTREELKEIIAYYKAKTRGME